MNSGAFLILPFAVVYHLPAKGLLVTFQYLSQLQNSHTKFWPQSEHQRMVQTTVITFTLISMSNLSRYVRHNIPPCLTFHFHLTTTIPAYSLACSLGSMVVLVIEHVSDCLSVDFHVSFGARKEIYLVLLMIYLKQTVHCSV